MIQEVDYGYFGCKLRYVVNLTQTRGFRRLGDTIGVAVVKSRNAGIDEKRMQTTRSSPPEISFGPKFRFEFLFEFSDFP
jgi:hypothetical protein